MSNFFTRHRNTLLHVTFWVLYATIFFLQVSYGRREAPEWGVVIPDVSFHIIMLLIISYVHYFFFLPRLIAGWAVGRYLLTYGPLFLGLTYLTLIGKQYLIDGFTYEQPWVYSLRFGLNVFVAAVVVTTFVSLLRLAENYFELEAKSRELENQQLTSELRFLRAQVNPHFLFNTLNNMYYLSVDESPRTANVIAKLAGMMRYMLYDSNAPTVPLAKEVEYMESYIELEKMRLNDDVPIAFEVHTEGVEAGAMGGVKQGSTRIVPLVLITFLENAFKHGISNGSGKSWITVSLNVSGNELNYTVKNSRVEEAAKTVTEQSGIGLVNVRRRLELSYPNRHSLDVTETETEYAANLKLQLS
ncbi:MAG: sensor histidine kinase [Saprospiraceae bacterium]